MKINIAIILVAGLLGLVGVAGADGQGPTDNYGDFRIHEGNLSYTDSGSNVQEFDFYSEPADGDIRISSSDIWSILSAKYIDNAYIIGPASDTWSFLYDAATDQSADDVQINVGLSDNSRHVRLLNGTYVTSGPIYINTSGVLFEGVSLSYPIIQGTGDYDVMVVNGQYNIIKNMKVTSTASTSAYGMNISGNYNYVEHVNVRDTYHGYYLNGVNTGLVSCRGAYIDGYQVEVSASECYLMFCNFGTAAKNSTRGLYVHDVGNIYAVGSQFLKPGYGFYFNNVHAGLLTNCYFDNCNHECVITASAGDYSRHITFDNCWIAGMSTGAGGDIRIGSSSIDLHSVHDITFSDCQIRDLYRNGFSLIKTQSITLIGNTMVNLARTTSGAVIMVNNANDTICVGNRYIYGLTPSTTLYGISYNGVSDYNTFTANNFRGADSATYGSPGANDISEHNQMP